MMLRVPVLLLLLLLRCSHLSAERDFGQSQEKGISLCAGNHIIKDAFYVVDQLRNVWNSTLPIAINHCGELNEGNIKMMESFNNVFVWNICDFEKFGDKKTNTLLNMDLGTATKRLKSWFCKTASLILSPFNETMVVDLDVVFFKQPDILFRSPAYARTGSLFFRDRVAFQGRKAKKDQRIYQDVLKDFIVVESKMNVTSELATLKAMSDGYSLFWNNVANDSNDALVEFQDSSVILMDSRRHAKTLRVMQRILPSFAMGWGDKEIYWIAATIAQEPFSFEPYFAGFYGDCGLLLHFDPNQVGDPIESVTPMYLNGEWLLEKVHAIGDFTEDVIGNPLVINSTNFNTLKSTVRNNKHCACHVYGCRSMSPEMNLFVLRAQWERLTRSASRAGPQHDCINLYKPAASQIESMLNRFIIGKNECKTFGCSFVPINTSDTWFSQYFCDPITFAGNPTPELGQMMKRAQVPPPPLNFTDGILVKGNGPSVWLVRNMTLHEFPNAHTFIAMGYDFGNVIHWPEYQFHYVAYGAQVQPTRRALYG